MQDLAKRSWQQSLFFAAFIAALIFIPAGTLRYWQAWAYIICLFALVGSMTVFLYRHDPALLERRLRLKNGEKAATQRHIQAVAGLVSFSMILVAGLDRRFGWSDVPASVVWVGDGLVVLSLWIFFIVARANTYASSLIEVEASQTVVSTGPYAHVRHPMYAGALLFFVGSPLALGSWWALLFVPLLIATIVVRLLDEEAFLAKNLPGYSEYMGTVRYRLIPAVW